MSQSQVRQNSLQEWLQSINCLESFTEKEIMNGLLIYNIISSISPEIGNQIKELSTSSTTLNRVTNWNVLSEHLKKFNTLISQEEKTKIIGGNQEIVIDIVLKLKEYHLSKEKSSEVDIAQIDPKKNINEVKSLLEVLLILMVKNFHLSNKEAVALLSNESKYLAHILTKGLKGEFKPIENFLVELNKYLPKVIEFCQSNPENVIFFLRSIKPALISKSETVSSICLQFFNRFLEHYAIQERIHIFETHLLSTYMLAIKRHPTMETPIIFTMFEVLFVDKNKREQSVSQRDEIINLKTRLIKEVFNSLSSDSEKYNMALTVIRIFGEIKSLKELIENPFFSKIVEESINAVKEEQHNQTCINIVLLLFQYLPTFFSTNQEDEEEEENEEKKSEEIARNLLENLKSLEFPSYPIPLAIQLFTLLHNFGQIKHFIAPNIYKLILERFSEVEDIESDLYQIYIHNFIETIKEFPSIPWNPILETIIARKKNSSNPNRVSLNEVEIDFFLFILINQNIDIKNALVIFDVVSKVFIENYHLSLYIIKIMVAIIDLFSRTEPIVEEMASKLIKVCLAIHYANTKKFSHKRKSLTGSTKTTDEEALMRIKNNSIELFILKIASLNIEEINSKIESLVAFNYIQMKDKPEFVKGFKKILEIIGNFDEIIDKYETEIKKAEEEAKEFQKLEKMSKEKEKEKMSQSKVISKVHSKSRYEQDSDTSKKEDNFTDYPSHGYKGQSFSMHVNPMNRSYLGITPSAQKGIEKFQKVYLNKIEKQDFEKIRIKEEEERFELMKKIYRKKMVSQYGIDIKGETEQIQYLFEFDSQEELNVKNYTKIPFYTNETEEDRDMVACEKLLKIYQKPLKVVFSIYSGQKKGQAAQNFDEIAEKNVVISSSSLFRVLKDFGFEDYISLKEVQQLCQKINIELNPSTTDFQVLDFDGFIEFFKQSSFLMFTRPPKDLRGHPLTMMLEETFLNLKLFAGENKINEQIFEEPSNIFFNETEAVAELNRKLAKNPDYILPEGYKKIIDKKISFEYGIFLEAMSPTYKIVFEVVDDLLFKALGVHVIEPFMKEEKITKARPALFVAERLKIDSMPAKHIPVSLKKEIMRVPIKSRTEAKECAIVLDEIITAIELGHSEIGQKHLNKVEIERKKQIDEQIRRLEESKRKRENRNRQAKSAIEQYKDKRQEREKELSSKKQEEERKLKEEKEKKEKEAEELKRKIDEYNKKKKEEEEEKLKKKKEIEEKEKKEREKFKQLNEETKRKIEEEKRKKEEEENAIKAQKEQEEKRLKEIEKKKFIESQTLKKKMVEEFKLRKSQVKDLSASMNKSPNKEMKNLESFGDNIHQGDE